MTGEGPGITGDDDDASLVRPFLHDESGAAEPADPLDLAQAPVRPFLVTSGRTKGALDIPIEAQVVATPRGRGASRSLAFEYRDIVNLCDEPLAVAEIAAKLSLHLGVTRVLIGDLQHHGLVDTYQPEVDVTEDVEIILRVIDGLRQRS